MPDKYGDTVGNRLSGSPCCKLFRKDFCLHAAVSGNMVGNALWVSTFILAFPKFIHYCISVDVKVCKTFLAFPKESPMPFKCHSNGLQEISAALPNVHQ